MSKTKHPKTAPQRAKEFTSGPPAETIREMAARLELPPHDVLLVGDGSGSGWHDCAGWGVGLVDHLHGTKFFWGGVSAGSVNFAETLPYLHALSWFHNQHGHDRIKHTGQVQVLVLTDSNFVSLSGPVACDPKQELPHTGQALWAAYREFVSLGYVFHFVWAKRSTTLLNWCADLLSSLSRKAVSAPVTMSDADVAQIASRLDELNTGDVGYERAVEIAHWAVQELMSPGRPLAPRVMSALERTGWASGIEGLAHALQGPGAGQGQGVLKETQDPYQGR